MIHVGSQNGQLEAAIHDVEGRIVKFEQKLAAAEHAHNEGREKQLLDILLSLNNQLLAFEQRQNGLQAPNDEQELWLPAVFAVPWLLGQQVRSKKQHQFTESVYQIKSKKSK